MTKIITRMLIYTSLMLILIANVVVIPVQAWSAGHLEQAVNAAK